MRDNLESLHELAENFKENGVTDVYQQYQLALLYEINKIIGEQSDFMQSGLINIHNVLIDVKYAISEK
jgi:hypothetical protein